MATILPAVKDASVADSITVRTGDLELQVAAGDTASVTPGFFARPLAEVSAYVSGLWARLSYQDVLRTMFATYIGEDPASVTDVCRVLLSKAGGLPRKVVSDAQCAAEYRRFAQSLLGFRNDELREKQRGNTLAPPDTSSSRIIIEPVQDSVFAVPPDLETDGSQSDEMSGDQAFNPYL